MIEAIACGTPVLAFRAGSVPEVVEEGVTGHIVDSVEEAVAKMASLLALDRVRIRRRFEARFTADRMARDYVRIYRKLLHAPELAHGPQARKRQLHPLRDRVVMRTADRNKIGAMLKVVRPDDGEPGARRIGLS